MRAGETHSYHSVSPCEKVNGEKDSVDEESAEEDLRMEVGETCGRVRLEEEGAVIKKLIDPKLPSQEAVDRALDKGACGVQELVRGMRQSSGKGVGPYQGGR